MSSFPIVELGDYINEENGRVLTEFHDNGEVACIKVGDMNLPENTNEIVTSSHWIKETSYSLLPLNSIVFPKRGAAIATNKKRITKIPCLIDNNCMGLTVKDESKLNSRYLFAFMKQFDLTSISNSAGIALRNNPDIKGVKIPLPPLSIQKEIVAEIEGYQKIINGAKAVVANYKPKIDIDPDWEMEELNSICDVRDGTHDSPKYVQEGGIPFITQKNITNEGLSFNNVNYISIEDHEKIIKRSNVEYGDIIFSMIGANRGMSCLIDDKRIFSIKNVGLIKTQMKAVQKFILYYLQSENAQTYVEQVSAGGAQAFVSLRNLRAFPIPLPDIEIQRKIVAQIEKEQALVNANKQLIEIFEQKIKDRIAKVWGK